MNKHLSARRLWLFFLVFSFLLIPPARAGVGDILSVLTEITGTLRNTMGPVLSGMQTINNAVTTLKQQVVWPVNLINQAKSFVSQVHAQLGAAAASAHSMPKSSATLANPSQFESVMRSSQSGGIGQLKSAFTNVYGGTPSQTNAAAAERNLMDVDDALAMGSMKSAMISDQTSEQMLHVADGLEQQASVAAPGSASMLTAQAQAANLGSQAYLHRMLAVELRQEAARLAHDNALRKRSAESTRELRNHLQQIMSRP